MVEKNHGHHHQHHKHHYKDASEIEKNHRLSSAKRRKLFGKALLIITTITAIIIASWVVWAYSYS